jgi:hypothetical protein
MTCKCGSERILTISGKANDMHSASFSNGEDIDLDHVGYNIGVPYLGGAGDYFEMSVCMDCGHVQDFEAMDDSEIEQLFEDAE